MLPRGAEYCKLDCGRLISWTADAYAACPDEQGCHLSRAKMFFELALKREAENPAVLQMYGYHLMVFEKAFDQAFELFRRGFIGSQFLLSERCVMDYLSVLYLREDQLPSKRFEDAVERALSYGLSASARIWTYMASAVYEMEYGCTDKATDRLDEASMIEAQFGDPARVCYIYCTQKNTDLKRLKLCSKNRKFKYRRQTSGLHHVSTPRGSPRNFYINSLNFKLKLLNKLHGISLAVLRGIRVKDVFMHPKTV